MGSRPPRLKARLSPPPQPTQGSFILTGPRSLRLDTVLRGSLQLVISQGGLAGGPAKHKLPLKSPAFFHGNMAVICTANNRSLPFLRGGGFLRRPLPNFLFFFGLVGGGERISLNPGPWACTKRLPVKRETATTGRQGLSYRQLPAFQKRSKEKRKR